MEYTRIFRILALAIIFSLLIVALPITPTYAITGYEDIELSSSDGEIGDRIYIDGYDFEEGNSTYIYFSSDRVSVGYDIDDLDTYELVRSGASADSDRYLDTYFNVPDELTEGEEEDVRGGNYYVYASYSREGEVVARTEFTVIGGDITVSPDEGTVGTEVEINGEDFGSRESITVEYDGVEVDIASGDEQTSSGGTFTCFIAIPESTADAHTITVTDTSDAEAEAEFAVEPEITISSTSGSIDDEVAVSGTGFGDRKYVTIYFDNDTMTLTSGTDRTDTSGSFENLKFNVPVVGPGTYDVKAEDTADNIAAAEFSLAAVASFSLTTGYVGTEVTVSGTGFIVDEEITISFAGTTVTTSPESVTANSEGNFSGSFLVPPSATGTYEVEVSDGTSSDSTDFTVLITASLDETTGNVGAELTVSGTGFAEKVSIKYDEIEVATTTADNGDLSAIFNVPPSVAGEHTITVSDAYNTKQFTFTMESTPPPLPTPLLPLTNSKTKAQAYFDWEDVTDPSGVTYTLQIASSSDFTSLLLEKKGLNESEYTLTKEESLQSTEREAPYYWRVKAVDGASNESEGISTGSFHVGFAFELPPWALYALIGIGAFIFFMLGFWMGRRTTYYTY